MPSARKGENQLAERADLSTQALFDLKHAVVLVTGGASGIGAMLTTGFVQNGATVYVFSRKPDAAFARRITSSCAGTCHVLVANLLDRASLADAVQTITSAEGRLDVLVNNAGTNYNEPIETSEPRMFDKVLATNLSGVFHTTQLFLPLLRASAKARGAPARVINVGSINGVEPPPMDSFAYSSSKAGLLMLTRHLAARLAPDVLVNALIPGPFPSRMMRAVLNTDGGRTARSTLLKRTGTPSDIFGAALLLAAPVAGAYMTGSSITIDGGSLLAASSRL